MLLSKEHSSATWNLAATAACKRYLEGKGIPSKLESLTKATEIIPKEFEDKVYNLMLDTFVVYYTSICHYLNGTKEVRMRTYEIK